MADSYEINLWSHVCALELMVQGLLLYRAVGLGNPRGDTFRMLKDLRDSVQIPPDASDDDVRLARAVTRKIESMQKKIDDRLAALGYEAIPTGAADAGHTE